jgi:hypothetical protein
LERLWVVVVVEEEQVLAQTAQIKIVAALV